MANKADSIVKTPVQNLTEVLSSNKETKVKASCHLTVGECFKRLKKAAAQVLENEELFEFRQSRHLAAANYGLMFKEYEKYKDLKDLSIGIFEDMIKNLLLIEAQREGNTLMSYNFGWKKFVSFHLRLYARTVDEYRDTILRLWNNDADGQEAVDVLTKNDCMKPIVDKCWPQLEHIQKHGDDPEFFEPTTIGSGFGVKRLLVSKREKCLVGLDSIDFDPTSDHPYQQAYQYARSLEEELGNKVLGRVYFGIDHSNKKIWVWGQCGNAEYEKFVDRNGVEKSGDFDGSRPMSNPQASYRYGVKIKNLPEDITEEMVCKQLQPCAVRKVCLYDYRNCNGDSTLNGLAAVFFYDETSVDEAVKRSWKIITSGHIWIIEYCLSKDVC